MINSTAKTSKLADFDSNQLNFNAQGVNSQTTILQIVITKNLDLKVNNDSFITGGLAGIENASFGDTMTLQVVDVDGIIAPKGYMINEFVTSWKLSTGMNWVSINVPYPAKIISGLYVRLIYNSVTSTIPNVSINYFLHKIMV